MSGPSSEFSVPPPPLLPFQRRRWWFHLVVLGAYPLAIGLISLGSPGEEARDSPALPGNTIGLLIATSFELGLFALVLGAAWSASRAEARQLLLTWKGFWRPAVRGFFYAIALRLGLGVCLMAVHLFLVLWSDNDRQVLELLRPRTETVVDFEVLSQNPVYLLLLVTHVSFIVAGLREELWRAAMWAGLTVLFPARLAKWPGQIAGVALIAVVFGLGHLPQGFGGVLFTTVLGLGLGFILIWHRSVWEAVFAHGFFDATSFLLLFLLARHAPELLPLL